MNNCKRNVFKKTVQTVILLRLEVRIIFLCSCTQPEIGLTVETCGWL